MAKTRIQFRTDKTANWLDSFTPLAGELCVFSDYMDTGKTNHLGNKIYKSNIKIGTGNKNLSSLSFFGNSGIDLSDIQALFGNTDATTAELGKAKLDSMILA